MAVHHLGRGFNRSARPAHLRHSPQERLGAVRGGPGNVRCLDLPQGGLRGAGGRSSSRSRSAPDRSSSSRARPMSKSCWRRTRTTGSRGCRTSTARRSRCCKTRTRASSSCRAASSISPPWSRTTSSTSSAATRRYIVYPETVARIDITSINTTRPPFDDKKLRQAMNYAVNKESIIQNVLFGNGEMATSFLPKMPGRDPNSPGYPYDLEKAKALVAESAGKDGFEADYNVTAGDAVGTQVAQLVAADLAQIGGKINVVPIDGNTLLEKLFTTFDFDLMRTPTTRPTSSTLTNWPRSPCSARAAPEPWAHSTTTRRSTSSFCSAQTETDPAEAAGALQPDPGDAPRRRAVHLPLLPGRQRRQPRLRQELPASCPPATTACGRSGATIV